MFLIELAMKNFHFAEMDANTIFFVAYQLLLHGGRKELERVATVTGLKALKTQLKRLQVWD